MLRSPALLAAMAIALSYVTPCEAADSDRARLLRQTFRDGQSSHVFVFAHRADWHEAPENSMAGIANCVRMGIDAIEIDVRRTKDGQYVLMHDKTIDRTTTGTGKVSDMTLAEIQSFRLRDADGKPTIERVPTLEQAVVTTQGKLLIYLDKTEEMIDAVNAEMTRLNATDQAIYYGSSPLPAVRKRYGDLIDRIIYLPKITNATPEPADVVTDLAALHPAAYVLEFEQPDSEILAAAPSAKAVGARIFASTMWPTSAGGRTDAAAMTDPDANWGWLIDRGVTAFCTDRPAELLNYLRKRGLRDRAIDDLSQTTTDTPPIQH